MNEKPRCKDHPDAHVANAACGGHREWVCIVCGKKLGRAPYYAPMWELERLSPEDTGKLG